MALAGALIADETFRIAGLVSPAVVVKVNARVTIEVINADNDTAHGLVITPSGARSSWMPMLSTPGTYRYLCPVPWHAQEGMTGTFTVTGT